MNNQITFPYSSNEVRVVIIDGSPWFVATDVCKVLEIANNRDALSRLDNDEKGVGIIYTPGGNQQLSVINESGLYTLILTSRKPEAKKFKKWVTNEVLPSIRRTGMYQHQSQVLKPTDPELTANDLKNIHSIIQEIMQFKAYRSGWSQACHYNLRFVTGTKSPEKYRVSHLPMIQEELSRIFSVSVKVRDYLRYLEAAVLKNIIRNRGNVDDILDLENKNFQEQVLFLSTKIGVDLPAFDKKRLEYISSRANQGDQHIYAETKEV